MRGVFVFRCRSRRRTWHLSNCLIGRKEPTYLAVETACAWVVPGLVAWVFHRTLTGRFMSRLLLLRSAALTSHHECVTLAKLLADLPFLHRSTDRVPTPYVPTLENKKKILLHGLPRTLLVGAGTTTTKRKQQLQPVRGEWLTVWFGLIRGRLNRPPVPVAGSLISLAC